MLKARYGEIEKLTSNILSKQGIFRPVVDIEKVAKDYKVTLTAFDLGEEISGMLVLDGQHVTIGYNSQNVKQRQRFTIAHELGHYVLHKPKGNDIFIDKDFLVKMYRSDKTYTEKEIRQEQEANAFAAALLMPRDFIRAEIANKESLNLNETELITELSKIFDVSIAAMTFRLANIDIL